MMVPITHSFSLSYSPLQREQPSFYTVGDGLEDAASGGGNRSGKSGSGRPAGVVFSISGWVKTISFLSWGSHPEFCSC